MLFSVLNSICINKYWNGSDCLELRTQPLCDCYRKNVCGLQMRVRMELVYRSHKWLFSFILKYELISSYHCINFQDKCYHKFKGFYILLGITFLSFNFLPMIKRCSLCLEIESKLMIQLEEVLSLARGRYLQLWCLRQFLQASD
jgi:hypothetical protein